MTLDKEVQLVSDGIGRFSIAEWDTSAQVGQEWFEDGMVVLQVKTYDVGFDDEIWEDESGEEMDPAIDYAEAVRSKVEEMLAPLKFLKGVALFVLHNHPVTVESPTPGMTRVLMTNAVPRTFDFYLGTAKPSDFKVDA